MKTKLKGLVLLTALFAILCTGCAPRHMGPPPLPPPPPAPPSAPA